MVNSTRRNNQQSVDKLQPKPRFDSTSQSGRYFLHKHYAGFKAESMCSQQYKRLFADAKHERTNSKYHW